MFSQSVVLLCVIVCGHSQIIPNQVWGYVNVRPDAHMFWWLYGSTGTTPRNETPLVMWLQVRVCK